MAGGSSGPEVELGRLELPTSWVRLQPAAFAWMVSASLSKTLFLRFDGITERGVGREAVVDDGVDDHEAILTNARAAAKSCSI